MNMSPELAIGDTVTLMTHDRKWWNRGRYQVVAFRPRDIDLCHAVHRFREAVPLFDIRRDVIRLVKDGCVVSFGRNPDFERIISRHIDKQIEQESRMHAGVPSGIHMEEPYMMRRLEIQQHAANGMSIEELVTMYRPHYPEMSERMLRTKILGLLQPAKPIIRRSKASDGTAGNEAAEDGDPMPGTKGTKGPKGAKSNLKGTRALCADYSPNATRKSSGEELIGATQISLFPLRTYMLPECGRGPLEASLLSHVLKGAGYSPADPAARDEIDVCIILPPFVNTGAFEFGRQCARIRRILEYVPDTQSGSLLAGLLKLHALQVDLGHFSTADELVALLNAQMSCALHCEDGQPCEDSRPNDTNDRR